MILSNLISVYTMILGYLNNHIVKSYYSFKKFTIATFSAYHFQKDGLTELTSWPLKFSEVQLSKCKVVLEHLEVILRTVFRKFVILFRRDSLNSAN